MLTPRISAPVIKTLAADEIFVLGSHEAGKHFGGAAKQAFSFHRANMGQGVGLQGKSYAIPTLDGDFRKLSLEAIGAYVSDFITFAASRPELKFLVTEIGCGIAGFEVNEIAPLFKDSIALENVWLPARFVELL